MADWLWGGREKETNLGKQLNFCLELLFVGLGKAGKERIEIGRNLIWECSFLFVLFYFVSGKCSLIWFICVCDTKPSKDD